MRRISSIIACLLLMMTGSVCCGQNVRVSDYNFRKAMEAFYDEDDDDKALKLVNQQIDETPDHVDSYVLRAKIYAYHDKYDAALRDARYAATHYKGKPGVKRSTIYSLMGAIYDDMEKYDEAVTAYQQALKLARKDNREKVQDCKFNLSQAFYNGGHPEEAEKIYMSMLEDDPGDGAAMVGLARNCRDSKDYEKGLEWLEKAETYDASYSSIYNFRAQILKALGRRDECVDAALKLFELDDDYPAEAAAEYTCLHYSYGVAKVKAEMNRSNADSRWTLLLIAMYEHNSDYGKALELYTKIESDYGKHQMVSYHKARCYSEMGEWKKAIAEMDKAVEISGNNSFIGSRGDIYRSAGQYEKAIADYKVAMEDDPSSGYEYYAIGWCHELMGDSDKALEWYDKGCDIDRSYAYLWVSRGDALKAKGRIEEAKSDYEHVLEIDDEARDGSCRHYALLGLGREDEAVEWIDKIIETAPNDGGCRYDKACLFSRMGRTGDALKELRAAFEKGYRKFAHMEHDHDMDPLRGLPEYKALLKEYQGKPVEDQDIEPEIAPEVAEAIVSEVQMKKMNGGTYEVPCTINGLPLKFIFDTGASDVTISSVEASFMLKNDYLSENDFKGRRNYLTASGEISEGAVINIKEVVVGDVTLKNISASVVKNQKAPLLLGQSVLERFGTITINNEDSKLIIKH